VRVGHLSQSKLVIGKAALEPRSTDPGGLALSFRLWSFQRCRGNLEPVKAPDLPETKSLHLHILVGIHPEQCARPDLLRFLMLKSKKRPGAVVYYCNHGYTAGRH
jgi:hypothetical protein